MKACICAAVLVIAVVSAGVAAELPKVNLDAHDTPLKEVASSLSQQSGASIIVDPKIDCKVTLSLNDTGLTPALDVLTKLNKLTWKKVQFAKPPEGSVSLDQIKSSIIVLASLPLVGVSVEDSAGKAGGMFVTGLPSAPDTTSIKLPDSYSWSTAYVILPTDLSPKQDAASSPKQDSAATTPEKIKQLSDEQSHMLAELAKMTPEQRQQVFANEWQGYMNLVPEARKALKQDRIKAIRNLAPQARRQFTRNMRGILKGVNTTPRRRSR